MTKTNTILKRPVNKLCIVKNTCYDTNLTYKAREQKLRREASIIAELKMIYES